MNNIKIKYISIWFVLLMTIIGCQDREIINIDNQVNPIVMDLSSQNLILDSNFPSNPSLTITWQAAKYTVPTAINYKIEASADETFKSPVLLSTASSPNNFVTMTVKQMNEVSQALGFEPDMSSKMFIRVTSYIGDETLSSTSNITSLMIKPYVLTYPDFYIVGAASYVGWTATEAQLLYKTENKSIIYTYLEKDQNFRFLGQKDWSPLNYALKTDGTKESNKYFTKWSANLSKPDGDDENIKFSGSTGIYKIVIDATAGSQAIEATASPISAFDIPQVYLVGNVAGVNWSAENAIAMTKTGAGVFEYTTTLPADAEFKFLGQQSFGDLDWGNISADGASGFLGPKGDNGNVKFVGDGGSYKITVNIKAGIYTIVKQ